MNVLLTTPGAVTTAYREGKLLVVPTGGQLPSNCVKCGAPAAGQPLTKTFHWHSPGLYFLALLGLLIYVIVAAVVQKKVKISVPFCEAHRSWRTQMNIIGAALLIGCIPEAVFLGYLDVDGGWIALTTVCMAAAGLVVLAVVGSSFTAVYIDDRKAKFKGAGEPFLAMLPNAPPPLNRA